MLSSLTALGKVYGTALEQRPILTKSATAGIIFALSDYLAQRVEKSDDKRKTNWTRISASAIVGFAYFGPAAHAWYEMIFRLFPSTSLVSTLQKAALGQLIFGPIFTCVFFASALLQAGQFTPGAWLRKIRSDLPGAWAAGVGFWPLVDFVSYSMVPPQWIPLFVNFCSLIWTIYLSLVANRSKK
jgi:protein Mpv17